MGTDFVQRVDTDSLDMNPTEDFGTSPTPTLWTTADVARFLGCSERQVYNLREEGLPSIRIGGLVRFVPDRVMAWLGLRDSGGPEDERARQLADVATSGADDAAECAVADLAREFTAPGTRTSRERRESTSESLDSEAGNPAE